MISRARYAGCKLYRSIAFNPNRIFAFLWDGHMYKSETGGLRWQEVSTGLPTDGAHAESIATDGDLTLAVLKDRLYSSTDGGRQWAATGEDSIPFWGRAYQVKIMPGSQRAYVGTDNGLYRGTYGPPWQWTRVVDLPSVTIIAPVAGELGQHVPCNLRRKPAPEHGLSLAARPATETVGDIRP